MDESISPADLPESDNHRDDWDQNWESFGGASEGAPASRYRQRLVARLLGHLPSGARVLDIGSGQGELSLFLAEQFPAAEVWGIEYSSRGVRRANELRDSRNSSVRFSQRDLLTPIELPPDQRGWADAAVCSEVLEHVDEPTVLLRNAAEYLRPQSELVITVPGGPRSAFDRHIGHRQHFTKASLRDLVESSGFDVQEIHQAGFPFFNLYRLLVIARGKRLIEDLQNEGPESSHSGLARLAFAVFNWLFRLNLLSTPFGWQIVAVVRPRPSTSREAGS